MSSNKYVTLSLYFTLSPEKSPAEAITTVNCFIKEKLCMEYKLFASENWDKNHPEVVRFIHPERIFPLKCAGVPFIAAEEKTVFCKSCVRYHIVMNKVVPVIE